MFDTIVYIIFFVIILTLSLSLMSHSEDKNLQKVEQGQMSKISYQGHTYVVWGINLGGGIVHDPDCECKNK